MPLDEVNTDALLHTARLFAQRTAPEAGALVDIRAVEVLLAEIAVRLERLDVGAVELLVAEIVNQLPGVDLQVVEGSLAEIVDRLDRVEDRLIDIDSNAALRADRRFGR